MPHKFKKISLLTGDIAILYASLFLALFIRYKSVYQNWNDHFWHFSIIFSIWIIIFYISNLYNLHIAINNSTFFNRILKTIGISGFVAVLYFYTNPNIGISPKTNLIIFLVLFSILFMTWRRLFNWVLSSYMPKENIGIIGYNEQTKELIKTIQERPHLGYRISFVIDHDEVDKISNLKKIISEKKISSIILSYSLHQSPNLRSTLFSCLSLKINILNLPDFYEKITGKIPLDAINQMWFLENLTEGSKKLFDLFKRFYDIVLALLILALTSLFWPIIGLIIKRESKGPVFFTQKRKTKNNKNFSIIKFRTMTVSSNNYSPTTVNDSRITKFGNLLRKTRIDEIPQVLNILVGDMSFVGPRPERPEYADELKKEIPFYEERMLVKPGLTGWDQISGEYHSPSKEDTIKKMQYDLFYIKNRSIYLDLSIILKTVATILSKGGM